MTLETAKSVHREENNSEKSHYSSSLLSGQLAGRAWVEHNANVSTQRGIVFHNTKTQVRESHSWLWANCSTSMLLETEAQTSFPRSLRHSFLHSNFFSPAVFWHTTCHAGAWQQPAPTHCWCSHPLQARTIHQDNERCLSGCLRRKLQTFLYKAKDYSVSLLPSTHPGGLQACVSYFPVVICLRQALWCSVATRRQCLWV